MRVPGWAARGLRAIFVAGAAYVIFRWLEPQGYGPAVLLIVGLGALAWVGLRARRILRARREDARADAWAEALLEPARRPAAIADLRAERETLRPSASARAARDHARLTLVLAELLEADGDSAAATTALAEVHEARLTASLACVVRHARAVAALSRGDADAAEAALDAHPDPSGDRAVDLRVKLVRGLIAVERGQHEEAATIAEDALDAARGDRELATEARVLRAVALDAAGAPREAVQAMHAIGEDMLSILATLGLPRVRALATRAQGRAPG